MEDKVYFYLVCELVEGGDLQQRLDEVGTFNEEQASKIMRQILLGLNFMHKLGIMHRDMKPANVLMTSKDKNNIDVKITDFGFATFFDYSKGRKEMCGSPLYMAPEILKRENAYN